MENLIIIPARIGSTRLKRKMLLPINGIPLIVRTYRCAIAANMGRVIVACDGDEIGDVVKKEGGEVVITDPELLSGTDRVFAALSKLNIPLSDDSIIVNVQGDQPYIDSSFITESISLCREQDVDIATPIVPIADESYKQDSVVKPVVTFYSDKYARAHYFSRACIPFNGPYFQHVGVYAYRYKALKTFVSLPASSLELSEKLEQLRALEAGMSVHTVLLDIPPPVSIDVEEDLLPLSNFKN